MKGKSYSFDSSPDRTLGRKVALGAMFSLVSQCILLCIQVLSTSLLARLLLPEDFGLVALSTTFTGLIAIFRDLGLSMATLQKENLTHQQVTNLFWLNLGSSLFLSLIIALCAPFIASFYDDPRLTGITIVSGFSLIIAGLTVQHQALMRREMKFKLLAIVDVVSKFIGSATAILWAYFTESYWALVFMPIISAAFYAIAVWVFCSWRPSLFRRGAGTMQMLHFGKDMLHYGVVNYFARNADNFIVGKVAGSTELGYYSRSYSLMLMPVGQLVSPLTGVVVSALSKLQNRPADFKRYYLEIIRVLSVISFAIVSAMLVMSDEIIDIFLGPQWEGAKKIFTILCFAAFWQPLQSTMGWVQTSLGHTARMVKWGYINSVSLIVAFLIGCFYGATGVAIAYSVYTWLIVIPCFSFTFRDSPIRVKDMLPSISVPLVFTIISTGLILMLKSVFHFEELWIRTLFFGGLFVAVWCVYFFLIDKRVVRRFLNLIRHK